MLRFLTAGESHGKALVMILEGLPAGLAIDFEAVTTQLRRRQGGYGRGRRMAIESDRAEPLAGIRHGLTTGAPVALMIPNKDWENWQRTMHVEPELPEMAEGAGGPDRSAVTRPRPGPRRPGRRRQIRARRHPRRPRARQRARNGFARGGRRHRAPAAGAARHRDRQSRVLDRRRLAAGSAGHHVRRTHGRSAPTRRCTASIRTSSAR